MTATAEARTAGGVFKQEPEQSQERPELLAALDQCEALLCSLVVRIKNDAAMSAEDTAVPRWIAEARTNFETGLMFAEMAITRPKGGIGRVK